MATTNRFFVVKNFRSFYLASLLVVLLNTILIDSLAKAKLHPENNRSYQNYRGICGSVDIRNTLQAFDNLKGCHVVEGYVNVWFFDNVNETELSRISFPDLVEITDYLLLYQVNGLRSLGKLFPNLSVIRGQNTFYSYSLVIYDMPSLQEISLYSLTDITRGYIRIEKNPSLCFINSIVKPANECPIYPGGEDEKKDFGGNTTSFCWNRQHCQKICPSSCQNSCNANGECCNDNCLGGCRLDNVNACTVCKNITVRVGPNKQCASSCPAGYYQYLERRCITKRQCMHIRKGTGQSYTIHNNSCILGCPRNFMVVNHVCVACEGACNSVFR